MAQAQSPGAPLDDESTSPEAGPYVKENQEAGYVRDPTYFFEDMVFLVNKCLFKIPRHHFKHLTTADGFDDQHPYRLDNIEEGDMKRFLTVLYPGSFGGSVDLSIHEWKGILKLADLLKVPVVITLAIKKMSLMIDKIDAVDRVLLGRKYSIPGWQFSGFEALVKRAKPLGVADAALGIEVILKIAEIRECCHNGYCRDVRGEAEDIDCSERIQQSFPGLVPDPALKRSSTAVGGRGRGRGQTPTHAPEPQPQPTPNPVHLDAAADGARERSQVPTHVPLEPQPRPALQPQPQPAPNTGLWHSDVAPYGGQGWSQVLTHASPELQPQPAPSPVRLDASASGRGRGRGGRVQRISEYPPVG